MADFEKHIWNAPVDSAEIARRDSIALANASNAKNKRAKVKDTASSSSRTTARSTTKKEKSSSSSGGSTAPRVSVRRQRH